VYIVRRLPQNACAGASLLCNANTRAAIMFVSEQRKSGCASVRHVVGAVLASAAVHTAPHNGYLTYPQTLGSHNTTLGMYVMTKRTPICMAMNGRTARVTQIRSLFTIAPVM
jgi:hypothetical protein